MRLWRRPFTDRITNAPSAWLEQVRADLTRAIDIVRGGVYACTAAVKILGAGISANPLPLLYLTGALRRAGRARMPMRVVRVAPTTTNVTTRLAADLCEIVLVDGSGQTATRDVILEVSAASRDGEWVIVVLYVEHATHDIRVISQGLAAPTWILGGGSGTSPEWVALWMDKTRTGTNANGEWAVLGRGDV